MQRCQGGRDRGMRASELHSIWFLKIEMRRAPASAAATNAPALASPSYDSEGQGPPIGNDGRGSSFPWAQRAPPRTRPGRNPAPKDVERISRITYHLAERLSHVCSESSHEPVPLRGRLPCQPPLTLATPSLSTTSSGKQPAEKRRMRLQAPHNSLYKTTSSRLPRAKP